MNNQMTINGFVSFTLDPMLSSVWPDKHKHGEKRRGFGAFLDWFSGRLDKLGDVYVALIGWALRHRRITLMIAVASLFGAFSLSSLIGKEFVPEPDLSEIGVKFETPVDASLEYTLGKVHQAEAIVRTYPEVISDSDLDITMLTIYGIKNCDTMKKAGIQWSFF